jgi:putative ABC transport system permease protein
MSRYDPNSVSCFYAETAPGVDQKALGKRIEEHFRGRESRQRGASGESGGIGQLLQSIGQAFTTPAAPAVKPTPKSPAKKEVKPPPSPVEVRSADDWAERFEQFTGDLKLFLTIMTSVGVTIAVLSIVNTMLMSVTERTIEFGILRANGWTRRNVMSLVTWESAVLGACGGVVGAIGGWAAVQVLNRIWPERLHLHASPMLLGFALVLSTLLGMLGGIYPAWRAARMSPMDAIRRG